MQHESLLLSLGLHGSSTVDEECAVCFSIFPDEPTAAGEDLEACLEAMRLSLLSLNTITSFLRDYIWHRDPFELISSTVQPPRWSRKQRKAKSKSKAAAAGGDLCKEVSDPHCLWGMVRFGDNIEDEWAVVALLVEMSRARPDISIQVFDDDGDFLLIEAAYALPRWLKPEIATNRVWIRSGRLHIIPLPLQPPSGSLELPPSPSIPQALIILKDPESYGLVGLASKQDLGLGQNGCSKPYGRAVQSILAPEAVQKAITERLGTLPNSARSQLRSSRARLPLKIAACLLIEPQTISSAIEAFFYRDADDMRAVSRMTHFPLQEADFATVPILMNRCQQSQLLQQRFAAPRGLTLPQHPPLVAKAAELGLKITAGFEILWSRAARLGKLPVPGSEEKEGTKDLSLKQLEGLPAWKAYMTSLHRSAFFEGEMEGSRRYRELLSIAILSFCSGPLLPRSMDRVSEPILRALRGIDGATERARSNGSDLSIEWIESQFRQSSQSREVDDEVHDEEWVKRQAEEVDRELKKREEELARSQSKGMGNKGKADFPHDQEEEESKAKLFDAADLVEKIGKFVASVSGLDGAEVGTGVGADVRGNTSKGEVTLDPSKLFSDLRRVLGMEQRGPDLDDDEGSSSDEGSSFFSQDDEDEEEEEEEEDGSHFHRELGRQMQEARAGLGGEMCGERWEARTATDSDDDSNDDALSLGDDEAEVEEEEEAGGPAAERRRTDPAAAGSGGFFDVYSDALEAQLRGTHMESSFERAQADKEVVLGDQSKVPGSAGEPDMRPIDLDMNLVKNLLKSVAAQQGAAGPASNLAGMLGLDLPNINIDDL